MKYKFVHARKGTNAQGIALVQLRITIDRKSRFFSTDIYVKEREWDDSLQEVINHPKRYVLNASLRETKDKIEEYHFKRVRAKQRPEMMQVQALLGGGNPDSFIEFCKKEAENPKLRLGTLRHLRSFTNILEESEAITTFADITVDALRKFDIYLSGRDINKNTLRKKHVTLRRMINAAIQKGHIEFNPYVKYKLPKGQESTRSYLSKEDIKLFEDFEPLTKAEVKVKDTFLFQVFTGIAYQDMKDLKQSDLMVHNGSHFIVLNRVKTGEQSAVPILPQALKIIEKHKDKNPYKPMLPVMANQTINRTLKDIATRIGIKQRLTTHVARHTFATTITLENGVPIESVSRMLGHAKISTTQIYAKITRDKLATDMKALELKLKKNDSVVK